MSFSLWTVDCSSIHAGASALGLALFNGKSPGNPGRSLFFKWIKQNLRIRTFYGYSDNAVLTQVWIAVCTYVLAAIVRKELKVEASLSPDAAGYQFERVRQRASAARHVLAISKQHAVQRPGGLPARGRPPGRHLGYPGGTAIRSPYGLSAR
jgi:hypothetical protein